MPPRKPVDASTAPWDIALPSRPVHLEGVTMAGFSDRATNLTDIQVVAHPAVMLIFDLGDKPIAVEDGNGRQLQNSVVVGLAPTGARGRGEQSFECLQIRLSPAAAYAVLGDASELGGTVVSLEDLWGPDAVRLLQRLRAAPTWDDRFAIAEAALHRRKDAGRAVDSEVALAWDQMVSSEGRVRVEWMAAEVGWSRKRLWSRFRTQIGLTPKRAAQLIRFDQATHRLAAGHSPAATAAESGYADQSHLHRDVMSFAGETPAAVAVETFLTADDVAWAGGSRHARSRFPERIRPSNASPQEWSRR